MIFVFRSPGQAVNGGQPVSIALFRGLSIGQSTSAGPTPSSGVFTVSGSEVKDRFPVTGVVYNYAAITARTN